METEKRKWTVLYTLVGILIFFSMVNACNSCKRTRLLEELNLKNKNISTIIDTIETKIVNKDELIDIIKITPAWTTLELEELSDKHKIPINEMKYKKEKNHAK